MRCKYFLGESYWHHCCCIYFSKTKEKWSILQDFQFEKNLGALSSYIHKIIYVPKKKCRKKKMQSEKKYRCSRKGVSECGKKNTAGKKNTVAQQKEWVSGSTIFSREKKIRHLWYWTYAKGICIICRTIFVFSSKPLFLARLGVFFGAFFF